MLIPPNLAEVRNYLTGGAGKEDMIEKGFNRFYDGRMQKPGDKFTNHQRAGGDCHPQGKGLSSPGEGTVISRQGFSTLVPPTLLLHRSWLVWILFRGGFWIHPVRLWGDFSPLSGVAMAKQVIDIVLSGKELATDFGFWESLHLSPFLASSDDC